MAWSIKFTSLQKCDQKRPQNPMEEHKILFVYICLFLPMPHLCFKALHTHIYRINIWSFTDFVGDEQQDVNFEFMHLNNQVAQVLLTNIQNFFYQNKISW